MIRFLVAVLTGLIGAALLHIIIILSLPQFTGKDAYTRVTSKGPPNRFYSLGDRPDQTGLSNMDPYLKVAVCHFTTDMQPIRLMADGDVEFWSLAIYDSAANEVFSMTDRTSVTGPLDVLIASPAQIARVRKASSEALAQAIIVEMRRPAGYAVLRTMAPQPSFDEAASDFLNGAVCSPAVGL